MGQESRGSLHLCHVFSDEARLQRAIGIKLFLVMERNRFKREDRFAHLAHRLDFVFETRRRSSRAESVLGVYENRRTQAVHRTALGN